MKYFALFAVILSFGMSTASAQQQAANRAVIGTMNGKCHKLLIGAADASSICEDKIINVAYLTGKSSFQFIAKDRAVVGFFGSDDKAMGDNAVLSVEQISLNMLMGTPSTISAASGTCTYSNPYAGPSLIQCSAKTTEGRFEATFVSDGQEPELSEL
jgi:hypothetical protein